jgi:hypothetical protein
MDEDGFSSFYPTQRAIAFIGQLELPGIPHTLKRVEIGYVLNRLKTQIKSVLVSHRRDGAVLWKYPIEGPAAGSVVPLTPRAPKPQEPQPSRVKPRNRSGAFEKRRMRKDNQSDEGGDGE